MSGSIIANSIFISPNEIGNLPDENEHFVSFKPGESVYLFSEPKIIREYLEKSDSFSTMITNRFEKREKKYNPQILQSFANQLKNIVIRNYKFDEKFRVSNLNKLEDMNPLRQIGYLSRNFFNSEFIVITR